MQLARIERDGRVPTEFEDPSGNTASVIEQMLALYARRGFEPPWVGYLAIEDGACVGTCAFTGPPVSGEVELAYFTFPASEGRGVATRMAALLMQEAEGLATASGCAYIAHTLPQEGPSTSVLRRSGFDLTGAIQHPEDGTVWKWRRVPQKRRR